MTSALAMVVLLASSVDSTDAGAAPERNEFHGRIDLSHTYSDDSETARNASWTDLRVAAEGVRLTGADLGFRIDGRARYSWTTLSEHRLFLTDGWIRQGSPDARWRFTLGRQTIRPVASAQVDGVGVEHVVTERTRVLAFAGLMPHPMTNLPNLDFSTAGAGYEHLGTSVQHGGGAALSLYRFGLDRAYLTEQLTLVAGPGLTVSGFLLADLAQPRGLLPLGSALGLDLTSGLLMVRLRPVRVLDVSLSASHQHTILPGRWWADWVSEELRRRGFVIDGLEQVGTRITSARLTVNLPLSRAVVPFARARYDVRHTEAARGMEALAGVKLRPGKFFAHAQGGWRRYFEAQSLTAGVEGGYEDELIGVQGGATAMLRSSLNATDSRPVFEAHGTGWVDLGALADPLKGFLLSAQYQAVIDSRFLYHVGFLQVGYRF